MFVPKTGISLMTHTDWHHSESITLDFTVKTPYRGNKHGYTLLHFLLITTEKRVIFFFFFFMNSHS